MTYVKICGITELDSALCALDVGAELLGFVFAPSRRQLEPRKVRELLDRCRAIFPPDQRPWQSVGVFANQPLAFVQDSAALCDLDIVQLSGDEPPECSRQVPVPVFKVVHLGGDRGIPSSAKPRPTIAAPGDESPGMPRDSSRGAMLLTVGRDLCAPFDRFCRLDTAEGLDAMRAAHDAARLLLDSGGAGIWGGTGRRFRWESIGDAARDCIVAGGLDADNVGGAISALHPWAVDVSSGVESGGKKDPELIRRFVREVRRADGHAGE